MNAAIYSTEIMSLSAEIWPGSIKGMWRGIVSATGLSDRRAQSLWYGEARRIDAADLAALETLRALARKKQDEGNDVRVLVARLAALEAESAELASRIDGTRRLLARLQADRPG